MKRGLCQVRRSLAKALPSGGADADQEDSLSGGSLFNGLRLLVTNWRPGSAGAGPDA